MFHFKWISQPISFIFTFFLLLNYLELRKIKKYHQITQYSGSDPNLKPPDPKKSEF